MPPNIWSEWTPALAVPTLSEVLKKITDSLLMHFAPSPITGAQVGTPKPSYFLLYKLMMLLLWAILLLSLIVDQLFPALLLAVERVNIEQPPQSPLNILLHFFFKRRPAIPGYEYNGCISTTLPMLSCLEGIFSHIQHTKDFPLETPAIQSFLDLLLYSLVESNLSACSTPWYSIMLFAWSSAEITRNYVHLTQLLKGNSKGLLRPFFRPIVKVKWVKATICARYTALYFIYTAAVFGTTTRAAWSYESDATERPWPLAGENPKSVRKWSSVLPIIQPKEPLIFVWVIATLHLIAHFHRLPDKPLSSSQGNGAVGQSAHGPADITSRSSTPRPSTPKPSSNVSSASTSAATSTTQVKKKSRFR